MIKMKTKFLKRFVLFKGIIFVALGILHNVAAYTFENDQVNEFILWFVVGGFAFLLDGMLDIYAFLGLKRGEFWAWNIALFSALFLIAIGPAGLADGHPFAPFIFTFGLFEFVLLMLSRKEIMQV